MSTVFIYALKEPDTGEIRYVGKTIKPRSRLSSHVHRSRFEKHHRATWIRSVLASGKRPELEVIDEVAFEHWQQWEVAWIEFFHEQGHDLTNATVGGEQGPVMAGDKNPMYGKTSAMFGKKHSAETLKRMSEAQVGNTKWLGRRHSKETLEKMSKAKIGIVFSLGTREKMRLAKVGRKLSEETRRRMSEAHRR